VQETEFEVTPLNFHKEQFCPLKSVWQVFAQFYDKFVAWFCQVESVSTEVKQLLHVTSSQDEEDTEEKQLVTSKNNSRSVITG